MVRGKRAWIRILEATLAVILITGVLVILYSKQPTQGNQGTDFLDNLQQKVLKDIASDPNLRDFALSENENALNSSVSIVIPSHIGYSVRACNLSLPCKLDAQTFKETLDRSVIAEGTIISSNITQYTPKKVMLFLWYR